MPPKYSRFLLFVALALDGIATELCSGSVMVHMLVDPTTTAGAGSGSNPAPVPTRYACVVGTCRARNRSHSSPRFLTQTVNI